MSNLKFRNIFDAINEYDVLLLDIWGVIIEGDKLYPGAVENINEITSKKQVYYLSNIPRPRDFTFDMLSSWGISTREEKVFTSGQLFREVIMKETQNGSIPIYHLGENNNHEILRGLDVELTNNLQEAGVVLISVYVDGDEELDKYDELLQKIAIMQIPAICANPDTFVLHLDYVRYCAGWFAAKLQKFGGQVKYIGKPEVEIYNSILEKVPSVGKNRVLMIGDSFHTDILGANRAGIHSGLVLTGNSARYHAEYENIEHKLEALRKESVKQNVIPNFVTDLSI